MEHSKETVATMRKGHKLLSIVYVVHMYFSTVAGTFPSVSNLIRYQHFQAWALRISVLWTRP